MALVKAEVRFTAKLEASLAQISVFWADRGVPQAYARLLDELGDTVIGNLELHPRIGRKFLARTAQSVEARERVAALLKRLGAVELREYLCGDYLLLYGIVEGGKPGKALTLQLLAIKHQRQLSFDFEGYWQANRAGEG